MPNPHEPWDVNPTNRPQDGGGTRLESIEEIRQALQRRDAAQALPASAPLKPVTPPGHLPRPVAPLLAAVPEPEPDANPYRPTRRPPLALLVVVDDGRDDGEVIRLRKDRYLLGRVEGDVVIAHETVMSGKHAELTRQLIQGQVRWVLTDLRSTNGTYVRVARHVLKHAEEFLLGGRRYRFNAAGAGAGHQDAGQSVQKTQGWQAVAPADLLPSLVEITAKGDGNRHLLGRQENWIGRDADCDIILTDDPFISPRHAKIACDSRGRWVLENNRSVNGVWWRVTEPTPLDNGCQFQLGEQRFLLRVL